MCDWQFFCRFVRLKCWSGLPVLSLNITFLNRDFALVHLQLRLGTYSQARSSFPHPPPPPPPSPPPQGSIKEFIIRKYNTLVVVEFRFISVLWCKCLRSNFIHSKTFNLTKYKEVLVKLFTAYYACWNADLNLTLVTGTTNGLIFQIIPSLIESCGVRFTCLDCKVRS